MKTIQLRHEKEKQELDQNSKGKLRLENNSDGEFECVKTIVMGNSSATVDP